MKPALVFLLCLAVAVNCSNMELDKKREKDRIARILRREFEKMRPQQISDSAPRPSPEALAFMMDRSVEQKKPTEFFILPVGSSDCEWCNDSTCTRFEYDVAPNVIPSTAKLMVYESGVASHKNLTIWAFCLNSSGEGMSANEVLERTNEEKYGWLFYTFPVLQKLTFWEESAKCGIEISGLFPNSSSNPPSLLVQKKEELSRIRRQSTSSLSSGCRLVSFNISFAEIGWAKYIVAPSDFEAGFCTGSCQGPSSGGYWRFLMDKVFLHNRALERSHGRCWATCCRPREYGPIQMLYMEAEPVNGTQSDGTQSNGTQSNGTQSNSTQSNSIPYSHRTMANIVVTSCWCD